MLGKKLVIPAIAVLALASCTAPADTTAPAPSPSATPVKSSPVVTTAPPSKAKPTTPKPATCSRPWKTQPVSSTPERMLQNPIVNVTVGTDAAQCADYVLVTIVGTQVPGFRAEYVPVVTMDGSGDPVPVKGGAALQLIINAPAMMLSSAGDRLHSDEVVRGWQSLREVRHAGSFEGQTTFAIGTASVLPFTIQVKPEVTVGKAPAMILIVAISYS